jgi:phosphomevalonate kinase
VDVATSLSGGVIRYRIGDGQPRPLDWPEGLYFSVYWSGTAADTRVKLERLAGQPVNGARHWLAAAADRFAQVFAAGSSAAILAGLESYCTSLRHFDDEHGLEVYAAGHAILADAAPDCGVVYKPCGAGGGDIGIALATSERALASFSSVAGRAGFRRLAATIDHRGAMLIEEDQA